MKGSIKDLLKISGVHGYAIVRGKNISIKLPSRHKFAKAKPLMNNLYQQLNTPERPGNIIELYIDDMIMTVFMAKNMMLVIFLSSHTNLALLRMTGKLVLANLVKEK